MTHNTELSDVIPNLWPAIFWLEGGCNPREVAKELRIYAERIDAARKLAASPAPLREADEGSGINDLMQRVIRHLQAQADYTPSLSNHKALLRTISEVRAFAAIKPNGLRARPCHKYGADPGCKCGAICAIDAEQGRVLRASGIEADGDGGKETRTLYELTGDIKDVNTLLVNRAVLRDLAVAYGRACIDWAQADPEDVQQKHDAMKAAHAALLSPTSPPIGKTEGDGGWVGICTLEQNGEPRCGKQCGVCSDGVPGTFNTGEKNHG
jgi:hypothetical protein